MEQIPLTTPHGWNAKKDLEHYEYLFGESQDYTGDLLQRIADEYQRLINVVDRALKYFERRNSRLAPIHPGTLALPEKLHRLSSMTNTNNDDHDYKFRFGLHINDCIWADAERQRVMQNFYSSDESIYLRPLCDLADTIGCAWIKLEEGLECEHSDYPRNRE